MKHYTLIFILITLGIFAVAFPWLIWEFLKAGAYITLGFFIGFSVGRKI
mgnify:CR=1 FL=1